KVRFRLYLSRIREWPFQKKARQSLYHTVALNLHGKQKTLCCLCSGSASPFCRSRIRYKAMLPACPGCFPKKSQHTSSWIDFHRNKDSTDKERLKQNGSRLSSIFEERY